jgi:hypothetical protein
MLYMKSVLVLQLKRRVAEKTMTIAAADPQSCKMVAEALEMNKSREPSYVSPPLVASGVLATIAGRAWVVWSFGSYR